MKASGAALRSVCYRICSDPPCNYKSERFDFRLGVYATHASAIRHSFLQNLRPTSFTTLLFVKIKTALCVSSPPRFTLVARHSRRECHWSNGRVAVCRGAQHGAAESRHAPDIHMFKHVHEYSKCLKCQVQKFKNVKMMHASPFPSTQPAPKSTSAPLSGW